MARIPIQDDLLTSPLEPVERVRLAGCKCRECGEVFHGKRVGCENCGSSDLESAVLSDRGTLYSYTVVYSPLKGDYKGPTNPFVPLGIGLVELPEGCRIVTPLTVNDPALLKVGMPMRLVIDTLYVDAQGNEVLAFKFGPAQP